MTETAGNEIQNEMKNERSNLIESSQVLVFFLIVAL